MVRRWTKEEEYNKRRELEKFYIKENKTIAEVAEILGIGESTVFDRMIRLGIESRRYLKSNFNNKRRDISFPCLSEKLAEFAGIVLGDGHIAKGQVWIYINNQSDRGYILYIVNLLEDLFGVRAGISVREDRNVANVFISSVDLVCYLRNIGLYAHNKVTSQVDVPEWIFKREEYKIFFLRGFFDTDGSIYRLKFGIQMSFTNSSLPLLRSTSRILLSLGYSPSNISINNLYLTRRDNLVNYAKQVGFGNPKNLARARRFGIID